MDRTSDRRRLWVALLLLLASVALVVGTGGFTSVSADRGVDVAVVPDEEAYLGVDLAVEAGGPDRKAISFVGFCTAEDGPLDASANVTRYKAEVDRSNADSEALAVVWKTDRPVSTVVLKTGGGRGAIEGFPAVGATSGTAAVGEGTPVDGARPNDYCPDGEFEAGKLEADEGDLGIAPDATPVGGGALDVRITNRFSTPLTEVRVTVGTETRTLADVLGPGAVLDPGESVVFEFETCADSVAVEASGEGVEVELERACP